jgi:ectoine hydroxylase-related dioxygenase (phytanoyl-CoA dioxygenase family)
MSSPDNKKRRRESLINYEDHLYAVKYTLNYNGFFHLTNTLKITDETFAELIDISDKKSDIIFNHNEKSKSNDFKRKQINITERLLEKSPNISRLLEDVASQTNDLFPHLQMNDWVIIKSLPGCKNQASHTDYQPSEEMEDESKIPINIIVALQDKTYINIWPRSHRLICKDLVNTEGISSWDLMSDAEKNSYKKINMIKVEMKKGDLLLFRGDLVHSGSNYSESNIRLHCFMDPKDNFYRSPNKTWIIHKHASEYLRNIIDVKYSC